MIKNVRDLKIGDRVTHYKFPWIENADFMSVGGILTITSVQEKYNKNSSRILVEVKYSNGTSLNMYHTAMIKVL